VEFGVVRSYPYRNVSDSKLTAVDIVIRVYNTSNMNGSDSVIEYVIPIDRDADVDSMTLSQWKELLTAVGLDSSRLRQKPRVARTVTSHNTILDAVYNEYNPLNRSESNHDMHV